MRFQIRCITHNSPVLPAGDELHFMPVGEKKFDIPTYTGQFTGDYELDWADLYCTGGDTSEHEFYVRFLDKDGQQIHTILATD